MGFHLCDLIFILYLYASEILHQSVQMFIDICESDLQPTVPKRPGDTVAVIRGQYSGKTGRLVERNARSLRACISLHTTGEEVSLRYGDICCLEGLR